MNEGLGSGFADADYANQGAKIVATAAEAEVTSARRTYNRRAGSYNHHLNKLPNRLVAKPLGFDKQARLVRFFSQ